MLSVAESAVLAGFKQELVARFGGRLEALVLFGSRARAEGHETSDLDVLVLVRAVTKQERRDVIDLAYERELANGLAISPLVRDALSARPLGVALAAEIERDGVPL